MLALSTKSCSVTINAVEQRIYFISHPSFFSRAQATRVVSFEEIEQILIQQQSKSQDEVMAELIENANIDIKDPRFSNLFGNEAAE